MSCPGNCNQGRMCECGQRQEPSVFRHLLAGVALVMLLAALVNIFAGL
jgi:hypothetical protein